MFTEVSLTVEFTVLAARRLHKFGVMEKITKIHSDRRVATVHLSPFRKACILNSKSRLLWT